MQPDKHVVSPPVRVFCYGLQTTDYRLSPQPQLASRELNRVHQRVDFAAGVVDAKARPDRGGDAEPVMQGHGAMMPVPHKHAATIEQRTKAGYRALDAVERQLAGSTYVVGDTPTLADIALYAYTHVADEGGFDLDPYPATRAWLGRVASEPGHVPIDA